MFLIILLAIMLCVCFSNAATIVIQEPEPQLNVPPGSSISFCVEAKGTSLEYSWLYKSTPREDDHFSRLNGENKPTLQISNVQPSNEGYYLCKISNSIGECVETNPIQLTLCKFLLHLCEVPFLVVTLTSLKLTKTFFSVPT